KEDRESCARSSERDGRRDRGDKQEIAAEPEDENAVDPVAARQRQLAAPMAREIIAAVLRGESFRGRPRPFHDEQGCRLPACEENELKGENRDVGGAQHREQDRKVSRDRQVWV